MKEITLTQGFKTQVDDADFDWLNKFKWSAHVERKYGRIVSLYAVRALRKKDGTRSTQRMHRVILGLTKKPKIRVDHEDHQTLNNQRYNLREASSQQNNANKKSTSASGFKGVTWNKENKNSLAQITVNRKNHYLGSFTDPLEAACAYDMAAVKHFGEFAHCNFAICD